MADQFEDVVTALADRYAVERELGAGGMATVYLAHDLKHSRKVAVKVLRPELAAILGAERFLKEIEVTANLQHPRILPLHDSGDAGSVLYYVMPYVEGESLRSVLDRKVQLPVEQAVEITEAVASALAYAHRQGVIHRDIKPENILMHEGGPLVADFGIALALSAASGERLTETGLSLGTPQYMSPEQATGDRQLEPASDVYSLGCVLYEMLAGDPPHLGSTAQAIIAKILTETPTRVARIRDTVPPAIDDAVNRALAKIPADRFQTADAFAEALRGDARTFGRAGGRNRVRRASLVAMAVTAVALVGVAALMIARNSRTESFVVGRTERLTYLPGLELDPVLSPDGRTIAYAAGTRSQMDVFVRQLGGGDAVNLTENLPGHHRSPQWSRDGTEIAFLTTDGSQSSIVVTPALGGTVRTLVTETDGATDIYGVTWAPGGDRVAYTLHDSVFLLDVNARQPLQIATIFNPHSVRWSPDGAHLVFVSGNPTFIYGTFVLGNTAPSSIWTVSVEGGNLQAITTAEHLNTSPAWTRDSDGVFFVSNRDGSRDVYYQALSSGGAAAGAPTRVTTGLDAHTISVGSADARLAYSVLELNSNIWSVPADGAAPRSVREAMPVTAGNQIIEGLAVSEEGDWLAFDSNVRGNQDVYRLRLPSGDPEQLTTDPSDDFYPTWSHDGEELAFYSFRTGNRDLFLITSDGRSLRQVTVQPAHDRAPSWSSDGNHLTFQSGTTGRTDVFVVSRGADGGWGTPRQITVGGGANPSWSPDGTTIAYVYDQTLRLVAPDGSDERVLVDGRDGIRPAPWAVDWGSNSDTVYYKAFDSTQVSSIWSVAVAGGAPRLRVMFDDPTRQSSRNEFTTDGRHFYFTVGTHESDLWSMEFLRR